MSMAALALAWLVASASPAPVLGTIPAYPGASRPFGRLETAGRALALTGDKPEAVAAYYYHGLIAAGWTPAPEVPEELQAARTGKPAWLTFTRAGAGRIDIQVVAGVHPKTHQPVTVITYETRLKL